MKIYISGPMTGKNNFNFYNFFRIERELIKRGYDVINPAYYSLQLADKKNKKLEEISYQVYMDQDMELLKECGVIIMLEGWEKSSGANEELEYALDNNFAVLYEKDLIKNNYVIPQNNKEARGDNHVKYSQFAINDFILDNNISTAEEKLEQLKNINLNRCAPVTCTMLIEIGKTIHKLYFPDAFSFVQLGGK